MFQQHAVHVLNPKTDIHFSIRTSFGNAEFPHFHDFYELFLLLDGKQKYVTNGKTYILTPGSLVLVRPNETHSRSYIEPGMHINVAFPDTIAESLFDYLGIGFPKQYLLSKENFPHSRLTALEKERLRYRLEELEVQNINEYDTVKTRLRIILFELFVNNFSDFAPFNQKATWFDDLLRKMAKVENFIEGVPRLVQLSGKSHEHLCRVFKEKKNCTPTEYINLLKIKYAANLLICTDRNVLDIALSAGFDSLSYFYSVFKKKFKTTPGTYRKQNAQYLEGIE